MLFARLDIKLPVSQMVEFFYPLFVKLLHVLMVYTCIGSFVNDLVRYRHKVLLLLDFVM